MGRLRIDCQPYLRVWKSPPSYPLPARMPYPTHPAYPSALEMWSICVPKPPIPSTERPVPRTRTPKLPTPRRPIAQSQSLNAATKSARGPAPMSSPASGFLISAVSMPPQWCGSRCFRGCWWYAADNVEGNGGGVECGSIGCKCRWPESPASKDADERGIALDSGQRLEPAVGRGLTNGN